MRSEIQYQYAKTGNSEITNISAACKNIEYYCLGCSNRVIPVQGSKNKHHYRHYKSDCHSETYYHIAGKLAFECLWNERTRNNLPIPLVLERQVKCNSTECISVFGADKTCFTVQPARYDLCQLFSSYSVEKMDAGGLIPDILLLDQTSGRKCYIEICNTHACSEDKINSNIPIIEIYVKNDDDLEYIINGIFKVDDTNIAVYNFKCPDRLSSAIDHCNSEHNIASVSIATDFRLISKEFPMQDYLKNELVDKDNHLFFQSRLSPVQKLSKIKEFLSNKDNDPLGYRNCFICDHVKYWNDGKIFCDYFDKNMPDTQGAMCFYFKQSKMEAYAIAE